MLRHRAYAFVSSKRSGTVRRQLSAARETRAKSLGHASTWPSTSCASEGSPISRRRNLGSECVKVRNVDVARWIYAILNLDFREFLFHALR